jgi:hypothetical protein
VDDEKRKTDKVWEIIFGFAWSVVF